MFRRVAVSKAAGRASLRVRRGVTLGRSELAVRLAAIGVVAIGAELAVAGSARGLPLEPGWLTVTASPQDGPRIVRELVAHGVDVLQLIVQRQSLEDYFMAATAEEVEHA